MSSVYSSEFFDSFLHAYKEDAFPFQGRSRLFLGQLEAIFERSAQSVLDLGCGEGFFLRELQARRSGLRLCGVDFSERALAVALQSAPEVSWVRASLDEDLPLDGERFDLIVSAYVLHHWGDAEKARLLKRLAARHLAPGGLILMGDIAFASQADAEAVRVRNADLWDDEEHYFSYDHLKPHLDEVGLLSGFQTLSPCCGLLSVGLRELRG